jgi:hypothetical protein
MKTKFTDIKIIELQPSGGGGGGTGTPPPPPVGDPENVIKIPEDDVPDDPREQQPEEQPEEQRGEPDFERKDYDPAKGKGTFNPGEILRPGSLGDFGGDSGIEGKKPTAEELASDWDNAAKIANSGGSTPAGIRRALQKLKEPVIDWKGELARFIDEALSKTKYKLPHRRFLGSGDIQYGFKRYKEDFENIVVAIDTSGSINRTMIEQFLSEVLNICEEWNPEKTVILYCDTQVYEPDILGPGDKPDFKKIAGGGGTNFWPPFKWVEKNMLEEGETPSVFIYFTDGEATFPNESDYSIDTYSERCIWVFLTFNGDPYPNSQPFGERIDIALANKSIKKI